MILGFLVAYQFYIRSPETPKRLAAASPVPLRRSCSTSGISTSSTTSCSSVRPSASAPSCGRPATARIIDGLGPDGISARVIDVTNRVVKLQTGYLYHYAFAMLIGVAALVTWMMFGSTSDDRLANPIHGHLPAAGRRVADPVHPGRGRRARAATSAPSRCGRRSFTFVISLLDLGRLRQFRAGLPDGREVRLAGFGHLLPHGRRRHFHAVRHPDHLPDAALHPGELGIDREAREGIHDRLPAARDADDRRLLRARHRALLRLLRGRPDPDVHHHRRVGRQAARLCLASSSSSTRCSARC